MKDRLDTQRAKARAMMPEMATGRSNLGREMSAVAPAKETVRQTSKRPMPAPSPISKAAPDRYQRPGPMTTERMPAYKKGGKVAARMAESRGMERKKANARVAESRGMERAEMRKDMRQDKKAVAAGVHKHERALHKGQPMTKLKHGGKAHMNRYADGGKVKVDEREVIEFTGDELADMERISKSGPGGRGRAAADAFLNQQKKGKSRDAADDAADVVRGFTPRGVPMHAGNRSEETRAFREQAYSGGKKRTAFAKGGAACAPRGKVGRYAMGGAAKVRQGWGQKVGKMSKGGNPVY